VCNGNDVSYVTIRREASDGKRKQIAEHQLERHAREIATAQERRAIREDRSRID